MASWCPRDRGADRGGGYRREGLAVSERIETIESIKARKYECFMEDHEPKPWTPGRCAGFAGSGSLAQHLFRCKRKDGHGLGGLFCSQHAKTGGY
jgi:hypothetical protein